MQSERGGGEGKVELYFLGTGAGLPSSRRNVTSIALRLHEERGSFWLIDCGEGTQQQMLASPLALAKLEMVFVTHLHGDHLFGLPGLLGSRGFQSGTSALSIFGPPGLDTFITTALQVSSTHLPYDVNVREVKQGIVFEDAQFRVNCRELVHGVTSFGYRFEEKPSRGQLRRDRLEELGVAPGPVYGELKAGHDVVLPDGRQLVSQDFLSPPQPGRVVVILGDTMPCDTAVELAEGADVLVHEATYAGQDADRAQRHHHSTAVDAATIAHRAGVTQLVLTHISARYDETGEAELLQEARDIHRNTLLARDHLTVSVARRVN